MEPKDLRKLIYRRQYILSPDQINCPFINNTHKIGSQYYLYAHPDLVFTEFKAGKRQLILLGDMFDYKDPEKNNAEILMDLADLKFEDLLKKCADFTGRYALILSDEDRFIVLHDATAARKVYLSYHKGGVWFSSNQHLLAKVLSLNATRNPSKLEYYQSAHFERLNNSDLGNTTYYDEITQLMSNHYFDLINKKEIRYWPLEPIKKHTFNEVVDKCSTILEGHLKSIKKRYKIMLPVTGGSDSRLLMSATRSFSSDVFYYLNQIEHTSCESNDIKTSGKLFHKLGMNFNILPLEKKVDPEFKRIYFENNPFASKFFLPHIYNYYTNHQDRVNLPGNIASAPWMVNQVDQRKVKLTDITRYNQVDKYSYIQDYYKRWMDTCNELCKCCNLNVLNLFYWEERINNWGNQVALDKDIAQEDINPLNSRILNELYMSMPLKYNNEPDKKLHRNIILNLWPELMHLPFNPSGKTYAMLILVRLGILTPLGRTLYKVSLKRLAA